MEQLINMVEKFVTPTANGRFLNTEIIQYDNRWIVAQRENVSISVTSGLIETSEDNSITFINSLSTPIANLVINAHIMRNGNIILVLDDNRLFLTDFKLSKLIEKKVLTADGSAEYPIHTPVNANLPGRYWYTHKYPTENNSNLYIWGNYCNVNKGAAPVNFIYTSDFGETIKIAYEFGQLYRDNGTVGGSTSTGTLLGDPNNTVVTRHTHAIERCDFNGKYYAFVGDFSGGIRVLELTYNDVNDTWAVVDLDFGQVLEETFRLKATGLFFVENYIYWITDCTNVISGNTQNGIWRANIENITDLNSHEKVLSFPNFNDVASTLKLDKKTNNIIFSLKDGGGSDTSIIGIAKNYGHGEVNYKDYASDNFGFIRLNSPNNLGYFRFDVNRFNLLKGKSFLINIGQDLFGI